MGQKGAAWCSCDQNPWSKHPRSHGLVELPCISSYYLLAHNHQCLQICALRFAILLIKKYKSTPVPEFPIVYFERSKALLLWFDIFAIIPPRREAKQRNPTSSCATWVRPSMVMARLWFYFPKLNAGWWFGTWILFSHDCWESHHPNWRSYFSEGFFPPPTRNEYWNRKSIWKISGEIVSFMSIFPHHFPCLIWEKL